MTTTLSLKLSPEAEKIMPWIISAKASGKPTLVAWAKREYEIAQENTRRREQLEMQVECRRLERKRELQERKEYAEHEYRAWIEERAHWANCGIHFAIEDGQEEIQPTQSSQKGWRRLLSECSDLLERGRYGKWGCKSSVRRSGHYSVKHNAGRKPRTPWFK